MVLANLYHINERLIAIQSLYSTGKKAEDQEVYLALDSVAGYVHKLDQRIRQKFHIVENFKELLKFSDLSMDIIKLNHRINYPWRYEDNSYYDPAKNVRYKYRPEEDLERLFSKVTAFIEQELPIAINTLRSLLDSHSFIAIDNFQVTLDEENLKNLRNKIWSKVNNDYDLLDYKTLECYYYTDEELANAPFKRMHWYKYNDDNTVRNSYYFNILNNMSVIKLVEIACDFKIPFDGVQLRITK